MSNKLTDARNAIWSAIENYVETTGVFNQKYKFNGELPILMDDDPPFSALPAIAVRHMETTPDWFTHREQKLPMLFEVRVWTEDHNYDDAEELIMKVRRAIWKGSSGGSQTYIEEATGYDPVKVGRPITFKLVKSGTHKQQLITRATTLVVLQATDDPKT